MKIIKKSKIYVDKSDEAKEFYDNVTSKTKILISNNFIELDEGDDHGKELCI